MSLSSKRLAILDEAITWLNTPYQHQCMVKGRDGAVDCAMFLAGVAINARLVSPNIIKDVPNYPSEWHLHNEKPILVDVMKSFGCVEKSVKGLYPGDICVFKVGNCASHLAILLENNHIIHALGGTVNKVTINGLSGSWSRLLVQAFKFPGL